MLKHRRQAILLILVIALPLLVYFVFKLTSTAVFNKISYQYSLSESGDTLFHVIPDFVLTDQNGDAFTREDMLGKVFVVSFFYSQDKERYGRDSAYSNLLLAHLETVYENIEAVDYLRILSITTAPEEDSLKVLQALSASTEVPADRWIFATGSRDEVYKLGLQTFRLKEFMQRARSDKPFTARAIALVDKQGYVRGYYEGTNLYDIEKVLPQDIRALLTLEYREDFKK